MSTREIVTAVCDADHGGAEWPACQTIRVSLDGESWEADLCAPHGVAAGREFAPFIAAARLTAPGPRPSGPRPAGKRLMAARRRSAAIRAWAIGRGYEVGERGRISTLIVAAYDAARGGRNG